MGMIASSKLKLHGTGLTPLFLLQKTNWDFQQKILQIIIYTGSLHFMKIQSCLCYRAALINPVSLKLFNSELISDLAEQIQSEH